MTNKGGNTDNQAISGQTPLQGWKEIAAYLERDARTARRWEQQAGLPVRRHGGDRGSVYAYPSELEAWRAARKPKAGGGPQHLPSRRLVPALAGGVALVAVAAIVLWGPIMNPPGPLAEAANAGGGVSLRQVWAGPDVDVMGSPSPDGRYLSYVNWSTGDLGLRDLVNGESHNLTQKGSWEESDEYVEFSIISPDGRQVAYAWFNDRFWDLRLIGVEGVGGGRKPKVIYSNRELYYIAPTAWFPDGRRILALFQRKDRMVQIVVLNVENKSVEVLKTLDWRWPEKTALSPDGRYVLYDFPVGEDDAPRDIFLLATDGSSEAPLVTHPANDKVLGWTPDGTSVLFASDRGGLLGAWLLPVADGQAQGPARVVRSKLDAEVALGYSSNGSFFYGHRTGMQDVYTASLDLKHGKLRRKPKRVTQRFVGANFSPAWSSEGKYVAYISRRKWPRGSLTIVIRSMETGEERDIKLPIGYFGHVSWGPNGHFLYFAAHDDRSRWVVFRLNVETEELTPIVAPEPDAYYFSPRVSPDGKTLYYGAADVLDEVVIRGRNLNSGDERLVYKGEELSPGFDLSPDGRVLAVIHADSDTRSVALKVIPAEGGSPRELLRLHHPEEMGRYPAWSADGRHVLFWKRQDIRSDSFSAELWSVSSNGGVPRRTGLSAEHPIYSPISVHPGGRQIAFTSGKNRTEIWVMENFLPETRAAK